MVRTRRRLLGLDGTVTADDLTAILAGRRPGTDERLTRAGMPGFDLTFRAPKSVSVLYALGDPGTVTAVVGAHEAAVDAAIGYLEREACVRADVWTARSPGSRVRGSWPPGSGIARRGPGTRRCTPTSWSRI